MQFNSTKYKSYFDKYYQNKSIKDFLLCFCVYAWEMLELSAMETSRLVKVDERQLTNTLVSGLAIEIKNDVPLPIRMFHSEDEKANGSDIELILQISSNEFLVFPCQAKRLYLDHKKESIKARYEAINHNEGEQIISLIKYAEKNNSFPLYMLYNYADEVKMDEQYPTKELYGCTLLSAYYLHKNYSAGKKLIKPTFQDLHPPAKPLTSLIGLNDPNAIKTIWGSVDTLTRIKIYTKQEVLNQGRWIEFAPPIESSDRRFISTFNMENMLKIDQYQDVNKKFNPKFKIVFTTESIYHRKTNFAL